MVAPAGAGPWPHTTFGFVLFASHSITGTSPPGPHRCGSTPCSVKAGAMPASKAFPPRSRMPMPTAVPIQCVEATTPNVPSISGRVVNWPGLMLDMGVLAPGVRFYSVTAITVGGQACPGNFRGSLALAAGQRHHGKDLEEHPRRSVRGVGGGVVLRRDLHDVPANHVEAGAAAH